MAVSEVAGAIQELIGVIREWIKSTPTRNMKNAIKNAEKYIKENEGDSNPAKLSKYKKKFDKYKIG